ncbi:MAG: branched-chain alpha-keto acid dehydrogenase subunit E2 [Rhodobacteraceae bacterium TMED111]|nr:branched-chain alpha-keto acid dehydrogenase subunit E2 [Marinovum sp.]OUV41989.1 MAG: branched-chain alpha-keto acid dehydrogenase subunit E2 [Rhodobacteraceae bacterium TMED111]
MWRSAASNLISLLVVLMLLFGGLGLTAKSFYTSAGPLETPICVRIPSGSSFRNISEDLEKKGALHSAWFFRVGVRYQEKETKLKAGSFLIPVNASMQDISNIVTKGGANTCGTEIIYAVGIVSTTIRVRELNPETSQFEEKFVFKSTDKQPMAFNSLVTDESTRNRMVVAEGATSWRIVQALNEISYLTGEIKEIPQEGSLAPDSYEFGQKDSRLTILKRMEVKQDNVLQEAWQSKMDGLPLKSPEEALILASIIEKETGLKSERRVIASVFINRLKKGMPLQTDPTVIYGITKGKGILGRGLRQSELRKDTPWNTYLRGGLPPTAIANPGAESIFAALNPDDTEFIFFVADGTGGHAFSTNLIDHNKNVAKWREFEKNNKD